VNIFYASPSDVHQDVIELRGQEAIHASKALRYSRGDNITVVDGQGGWYEGEVHTILSESVRIAISSHTARPEPQSAPVLGIGIIKKQDRLEFAVEKAVELGVKGVQFFRGEHSVKQNVRLDRLQSVVVSAMKQSLRAWKPELRVFKNLEAMADYYGEKRKIIASHQTAERSFDGLELTDQEAPVVLLTGPEGGFSNREQAFLKDRQTTFVRLNARRLRTETAGITMLAQYHFCLTT